MKNNKGITLIALVITIIVLLILAGVSIAMLTGENGILNQATRSVDATEIAEAKELAQLDLNAAIAKFYEEKYVNENTTVGDTIGEYIANGGFTSSDTSKYTVSAKPATTEPEAEATATITLVGVVDEDGAPITGTISVSGTDDGKITWSDET